MGPEDLQVVAVVQDVGLHAAKIAKNGRLTILDEILAHKWQEVAERKARVPLSEIERLAAQAMPPRPLQPKAELALIAEGSGAYKGLFGSVKVPVPIIGTLAQHRS